MITAIVLYLFIGAFLAGVLDDPPYMEAPEFFVFIIVWPFALVYEAGYRIRRRFNR